MDFYDLPTGVYFRAFDEYGRLKDEIYLKVSQGTAIGNRPERTLYGSSFRNVVLVSDANAGG